VTRQQDPRHRIFFSTINARLAARAETVKKIYRRSALLCITGHRSAFAAAGTDTKLAVQTTSAAAGG
jgi:hypothetical protein